MSRGALPARHETFSPRKGRAPIMLLAAGVCLALGVSRAVSGLEFGRLCLLVFLGLALGWLLAASQLSGRPALLVALPAGLLLLILQTGDLGRRLLALAAGFLRYLRQGIIQAAWPAAAPLRRQWGELSQASAALIIRLYHWLLALIQGRPAVDPVAITLFWLLLFMAAAVWAGWAQRRRRQPLRGLLPALLLLAALLANSSASPLYLAPLLLLALVLQSEAAGELRERSWAADALAFSPRFGRDQTRTAAALALALILVALVTPSFSVYRLLDYGRSRSQQQRQQELARSLGIEAPAVQAGADVFLHQRQGGLPARHLIGSGPELSQQRVMVITVEQPASLAGQLRYWRGLTYDRYDGRGWETRGTTTVTYRSGEMAQESPPNQRLVRLAVLPLAPQGPLIYTAGRLLTVDQPFQVAWRGRYQGTEIYLDPFAAAIPGETARPYRVDSQVPDFTAAELRAAGTQLPDWITEHYLVLPEVVSNRVRALALDLTATQPTPYDRALALEDYLRQFPYTLDLPAPPAGREIADYFLFELQRGYCDYFATTMVVLARAAGLPARLATGFVGGQFDEQDNRYLVTADLAHSWPEIYFPGYGWIPFEPTSGREPIAHSERVQLPASADSPTTLEPISAARRRAGWTLLLRLSAGAGLLVLAVLLGRWLLDLWRLRWLSPDKAVRRLFAQLSRSGSRLGVPPAAGETPHEFAQRLGSHLHFLCHGRRGLSSLAAAPEAIYWLIELYTRCLYSPFEPDRRQQALAIRTWAGLRRQMWWAALLRRF